MDRIRNYVEHPEILNNYKYVMGGNLISKTLRKMKTSRMEMAIATKEVVEPKYTLYNREGGKVELGYSLSIKA